MEWECHPNVYIYAKKSWKQLRYSESDFTLNWSNVFLLLKYLEFIQIFCMIVGETFLYVASQIPLVSNK